MSKRIIFYNYKQEIDVSLPSSRNLYKLLGEYDTLAEYTMLTVLDFEKYYDKKMVFSDYVTFKAQEHHINLRGGVTLGNYKTALCKSFIVNSYTILSVFIKQYRDDIRNLFNREFDLVNDDKISELDRLLKAISKEFNINPQFPSWLLPVMNYYRTVRNNVAHNQRDKNSCSNAYSKIDLDTIGVEYWVFKEKAPNPVNSISMNDLYFYSACIKHVANYLVMALKGRVNWHNLGNTHCELDPENINKGTNSVALVNRVFMQYNHHGTKDEIRDVLDVLKNRKEEYKRK